MKPWIGLGESGITVQMALVVLQFVVAITRSALLTSRVAAEYGSQGQGVARRPWILVRWIPRPEGAQFCRPLSGLGTSRERGPRVTLAELAHPGLPSDRRSAAR